MAGMVLSKWGNSLAFRIPKLVLEANKWQPGDLFDYEVHEGRLTIQKIRKVRKYDAAKLLEGIENMPREEIVDWGVPQGREIW